jgi:hypothetical protein
VAQEELLERGRAAHQASYAGLGEQPQHLGEGAGLGLEPHAAVVREQAVHACHVGQAGRARVDVGLHGRAREVAQLGERAALHGPPPADDAHAVAQGLDLGQDVAREEHRATLPAGFGHADAEDALHEGVEPRGGLVEQQQLDVGGQGGDEGHLLPVALRVRALLAPGVELEALEEVGAAAGVEPAAKASEQVDHLAAGQGRPQRDVAGHVGQAAVERGGLAPGVAAEKLGRAAVGAQEAEEDPEGGGLAGPVRAEEAVDLAAGHLEVEAVERARAPERLAEAGHADDRSH